MNGGHWGYIIAAYAVALLLFGGFAAFMVLANRRAGAQLAALESRGLRRPGASVQAGEAETTARIAAATREEPL